MDFEIKDLEIIESENQHRQLITESTSTGVNVSKSLILNELSKENEELQNKVKLNYRRLLLFETENNKLIEEKNKLFFDAQNNHEKNLLLAEKNAELERLNILAEKNQQLFLEKISSLEKVNTTQFAEIKRFSKFHAKIQDVVKPFIVQLKKQILELRSELMQTQKINTNLTTSIKEYSKKVDLDLSKKTNEVNTLNTEKNALVQTYEEQIHAFSKEILDLQSRQEDSGKEITRLKKAVEFKNYFENEVIRFKRSHEEDRSQINELAQKASFSETKSLSLEQQLLESKAELTSKHNRVFDLENNLEVTRSQLSKKMDDLSQANERLARLEKLNNQLSLEMSERSQ